MLALLIIPVVILLVLNSTFIFAETSSSSESDQKSSITLKSSYEEDDDSDLDEEKDIPITGTPLERASVIALAHIGEGRVTDSEIGDEEGYYEIEITLENGNEVDVHLDENFNILSTEWEDEDDD